MFIRQEQPGGVEILPDGYLVAGLWVGAQVIPQPLVVSVVAHLGREEGGDGLRVSLDLGRLLHQILQPRVTGRLLEITRETGRDNKTDTIE